MTALLVTALFGHPTAEACGNKFARPLSSLKWKQTQQELRARKPASGNSVDFAAGHPAPAIEARLGNLFIQHLGEPSEGTTLSIPIRFLKSNFRPFGDQQTNASVEFGPHWTHTEPPLIVVQKKAADGTVTVTPLFHPSLNVTEWSLQKKGSIQFIRPKGWSDWFVFRLESQHLPAEKMVSDFPAQSRALSNERGLPDPEKLKTRAQAIQKTPFELLGEGHLGQGYTWTPFEYSPVHGNFPDAQGRPTATGRGWTWLVERGPFSPLKHLYSCFERRNPEREKQLGVPSGSGWHHVGDPAETLVNSLEDQPLLAALGEDSYEPAPDHGFAYGLNGFITAKWLQPKDAFYTKKGQFHWYAITASREVCAEIWVHPCEPNLSNQWGMNCS